MKQYEFNEHGMCTNPDYFGGNDYQNSIRTHLKNGKWYANVSYTFTGVDFQGGSHSVKGEFNSQRDAVVAACKELQDLCKNAKTRWRVDTTECQACIDKAYSQVTQLNLF